MGYEEELTRNSYRQTFQIYDPRSGWIGSPLALAGPRNMAPPRVLWTGEGFIIAMMTYDGEMTPSSWNLTSQVYSLAPDGTLRESFNVDSGPAIYPNVMWAGGRVALTWSRVTGGEATAHYLQYLSCPP